MPPFRLDDELQCKYAEGVAELRFEWDAEKAAANSRKHRVGFDEATTVFADPLSLLMPDPDHSIDENRYVAMGRSRQGKLLVVTFVERPPRTRLISARKATRMEQWRYEVQD